MIYASYSVNRLFGDSNAKLTVGNESFFTEMDNYHQDMLGVVINQNYPHLKRLITDAILRYRTSFEVLGKSHLLENKEVVNSQVRKLDLMPANYQPIEDSAFLELAPYFSYTKSFELELTKSNQLVIKARVYTTLFKKTETNAFKLNLRDVKISHMSDVALMFDPIKSKKSIKMIDGNACVERLLDWNDYHHQLVLNVYDSEFTSDEQSKLYNAFKYLQELSLGMEVVQANDSDFFSSKNYNNRNKLNGPNAATVPLISSNGVFLMDVTINNKPYRLQ